MEDNRSSKTAEAAAAARAYHVDYQPPVVFADPLARSFLRGFWRLVLATPLRYVVFEKGMKDLKSVGGQVLARSRFAEDRLAEAILRDVRQYVIIGAGYDSYCLRQPHREPRLRIFEIDHPATQREKLARLERVAPGSLPDNLEFVPVDFEHEQLSDGFARSGFSSAAPAFFSWLGTTPYLTNRATLASLSMIVEQAAPGSEIVFDFLGPERLLRADSHRQMYRTLKAFTERRGEPLIGEFEPEELAAALDAMGLEVLQQLDHEAQHAKYFEDRGDNLCAMPGSYLVHARVTG